MKNTLILFFIILQTTAFAQTKVELVNGNEFTFKSYLLENESGDSIKNLVVFRGNTKLLSHTILKAEGDHNSEAIEVGSYEIKDTTVIFYTYWSRAGDAPVSPYGVRKQIYAVNKKGVLNLHSSQIYIETSRSGWAENRGIEYLFTKPKNEAEVNELSIYKADVEKEYNSKFVLEKDKNLLMKEIKTKLRSQIKESTKHWKATYSNRLGGYKI